MRMHAHDANREVRKKILSWFEEHGRHDLPWRKTMDPYRILVSEVMLQQTQVSRVMEKYPGFLKRFPTVQSLAKARMPTVLTTWQGLGYNRRALYLHRAARKIVNEFHGRFPRDVRELELLPGVGPYTARAVRVFAWNEPEVFIETNIRRVFIHHFFPQTMNVSDSSIEPFVRKCLWKKDPRRWYWALMDYGALALGDVPNDNRRSKHYIRQSRFEGSTRQTRAEILRHLLRNRGAASASSLGASQTIILSLERDGFLHRNGDTLTLAR